VNTIGGLVQRALERTGLVQSFSGVRAGFGEGPGISDELAALALAYGFCYAREALQDRNDAELLIGRDPRPTGEALGGALSRGFLAGAAARGCRVRIVNLDIITTPLIQTAVRALEAAGGVMITASHNPLTDNGFKFIKGCPPPRTADPDDAPPGALVSARLMAQIVREVRAIAEEPKELLSALEQADDRSSAHGLGDGEDHQRRIKAERAYLDAIGADWGIQPHCLKPLVLGPTLLDPNGGAACGIGARVLEHFGVRAIEVNAELGYPEHGIDTDSIDPASGKHMLLRVARAALRSSARFGVAFDYDADRGNLVLPGLDESAIIPPQTVAAANVALALAHRKMIGPKTGRLAVVMSDSTSGASAEVAGMFGAEVLVVETGEINVVTRMHQLRREGCDVPIGVEGANGGTIFGTSTCRDGLQTAICAAIGDEQLAIGTQWPEALCGGSGELRRLSDILAAVPSYYNRLFRLRGPDLSHGEVKSRMEEHFKRSVWPDLAARVECYEFRNYEGTGPVQKRSGDESGGWRVSVYAAGKESFIFARGSRTEAGIWRMIVDSPDPTLGETLVRAGLALYEAATGGCPATMS
jgi:phosphomannomutase